MRNEILTLVAYVAVIIVAVLVAVGIYMHNFVSDCEANGGTIHNEGSGIMTATVCHY